MATEIVLKKDVKKNSIIIEGFPGVGFVGAIAAAYMVDQLKMDYVGYIKSDRIPSIVTIHNLKLHRSMRIYAKDDLIIVVSELIIPSRVVQEISDAIVKWFEKIEPRQVISLAGVAGMGIKDSEEHTIFGISTNSEMNEKIGEIGVKVISDGVLAGIAADLLIYCDENNIPATSLMVETKHLPDPMAAVSVLKILNKLLNLQMSLKHLIDEGKKIEKLFKELTEQIKRGREKYRKMEGYSPMYG